MKFWTRRALRLPEGCDSLGPRNRLLGLFLVSVLGLFLEMLLVRWIGTEIRIFAYLQNTVLVVCFLGLGMGCFTSGHPVKMRRLLLPLAVLCVILAVPSSAQVVAGISERLSRLPGVALWRYQAEVSDGAAAVVDAAVGLALTGLVLLLVWEMFVPIGRLMARLMDQHPRTIAAYSVNVAGSLAGIWLFVLLSAWYLPPAVWMAVVAAAIMPFVGRGRERLFNCALLGVILMGAMVAGRGWTACEVVWSPYQKLALLPVPESRRHDGDFFISVNNVGYQAMVDLSPAAVAADPEIPVEMRGLSQYDVPLLFKPRPQNVLIVGAGSGNDAAGALRGGAERVTAVDIDPAIIDMGRRYHPEHPYQSPRVRLVNDDARSFFATTREHYDLIIFGLLDSHTTTAMTNARLDHYVYTRESLERARELLSPGGVMVLTFMVQEPFIADRMASTLEAVFGHKPLVFARHSSRLGWGGTTFVAGDPRTIATNLAAQPKLAAEIARWQADLPITLTGTTPMATDDWPYIYLQKPAIPALYWILAGLLPGLVWYGRKRLGIQRGTHTWDRWQWHFFFLGAAFLLLEVQNISKAAVVLGNTWLVNAVIISGVLVMALVANLIAARWPRLPLAAVSACLLGSCLGLYFFDLARLASLAYPLKATLVGLLTALPMLFSGIVFIHAFARTGRKDLALGANLLGALAGALLQSVTFLTGMRALLLIVAGLYLAAMLVRPKADNAAAAEDETIESGERQLLEAGA
jgi:spermidine synthase